MRRRAWLGHATVAAAALLVAAGATGAQPAATPLIEAAARGDLAAVRRLVAAGASLEARDASGRTALLAAVQGGHEGVALALVALGADVNAQDNIDDSPFLLAGARRSGQVLCVL
jgi:hypothetical protein